MPVLSPFILNEVELPLIPVVAAMEEAGYPVDAQYFRDLTGRIEPQLKTVVDQIKAIGGPTFNPKSDKQVAQLLYQTLGLEIIARTKKGAPATDGGTLERLTNRHPVIPLLLRLRELNKIGGTYCTIPSQLDADGRFRVEFNQLAADTGRFSSKGIIQTLPKSEEFGIRNGFCATPGHQLIGADFKQQELVILAQVSGDKHMREAIATGTDLHGLAAVKVYHLDCAAHEVELKYPDKRKAIKSVQFGLLYGKQAFSLAQDLKITKEEAEKLVADYFKQFPAIQQFIAKIHKAVVRDGFVDDTFGRRRQFPEATRHIPRKRYEFMNDAEKQIVRQVAAAKRAAQNFVIQGAAATITKLAMIRCHQHITTHNPSIKMILTLHDELHFEVPDALVEKFAAELPDLMCNLGLERFGFTVPLRVDVKVGRSWGTMKKLNGVHDDQ